MAAASADWEVTDQELTPSLAQLIGRALKARWDAKLSIFGERADLNKS